MSTPPTAGAVRPPVPALSARLSALVALLVIAAFALEWVLSALDDPHLSPARIVISSAFAIVLFLLGRWA